MISSVSRSGLFTCGERTSHSHTECKAVWASEARKVWRRDFFRLPAIDPRFLERHFRNTATVSTNVCRLRPTTCCLCNRMTSMCLEINILLIASLVRGYEVPVEQLSRVHDVCWVTSIVRFSELL